jgi:hypothetical protein
MANLMYRVIHLTRSATEEATTETLRVSQPIIRHTGTCSVSCVHDLCLQMCEIHLFCTWVTFQMDHTV